MTHAVSPVHSIRRRLFLLLVRAFGIIVLLTVLVLLGAVAVFAGTDAWRPGIAMLIGDPLLAYYQGHGSWAGVESIGPALSVGFTRDVHRQWQSIMVLDAAGRIVLDGGRADTARIAQVYVPQADDLVSPLTLQGREIGRLVLLPVSRWESLRLLAELLFPLTVISVFTGSLTVLIGLLLTRRVVEPLADVVAAAQLVAAGDLTARAEVCGPGDLRGLTESFNQMADALEGSDRERRALLADVAHELRTPLTVIRGRLEGIVDGIYPADEAHVAPVLEETYVLERLVEDLRQLTLAEAHQLLFERKPAEVGDIAARAADLFSAEATEAGIGLTVRVAAPLPPALADAQRVAQVIGNLLSNALRYTPRGGQVTLLVDPAPEGVCVSVADTGEGIAAHDLPHIFDRFYRGEKSRARASGGAGLGLAIARAWVVAMDGQIGVDSTLGQGSRFWFTLPLAG